MRCNVRGSTFTSKALIPKIIHLSANGVTRLYANLHAITHVKMMKIAQSMTKVLKIFQYRIFFLTLLVEGIKYLFVIVK